MSDGQADSAGMGVGLDGARPPSRLRSAPAALSAVWNDRVRWAGPGGGVRRLFPIIPGPARSVIAGPARSVIAGPARSVIPGLVPGTGGGPASPTSPTPIPRPVPGTSPGMTDKSAGGMTGGTRPGVTGGTRSGVTGRTCPVVTGWAGRRVTGRGSSTSGHPGGGTVFGVTANSRIAATAVRRAGDRGPEDPCFIPPFKRRNVKIPLANRGTA